LVGPAWSRRTELKLGAAVCDRAKARCCGVCDRAEARCCVWPSWSSVLRCYGV